MTAHQTKSDQAKSASFEIGYGKPPKLTQFQKGRSGNPGGRPRREPVEQLKTLTLQEAYRGIVIKENGGVGEPALAIQALLRSQMERAIKGDVRAQRDILNALRAYERQDAEKAAVNEYVDELVREAKDVEGAIWEAMHAAPTAVQRVNYIEAAQRVREMLGLNKNNSAARSGTGASGTESGTEESLTEERVTEERVTEARVTEESGTVQRNVAPAAPRANIAPQTENGTALAAPPAASPSPPPSADPPAASPAADPRPWSRHGRDARRRTQESAPCPGGANMRAAPAYQVPSRPGTAGGKNQKIPC